MSWSLHSSAPLGHALFTHQWGSLCFKIFLRTCLSERVLGKHAQSLLSSEELVVLLPCGSLLFYTTSQAPKKSPDLKLPYSEEQIVFKCALAESLHCFLAGGIPTAWFSRVSMQSQGSKSLYVLSWGSRTAHQGRPPLWLGKMLPALGGNPSPPQLFQVLGMPREECNSRQLLLLANCQFK